MVSHRRQGQRQVRRRRDQKIQGQRRQDQKRQEQKTAVVALRQAHRRSQVREGVRIPPPLTVAEKLRSQASTDGKHAAENVSQEVAEA